jgi:hypothetical protein
MSEKLKCPRPAKKPHTNGCALESQLWDDVVEAKRVYREQKLEDSFSIGWKRIDKERHRRG